MRLEFGNLVVDNFKSFIGVHVLNMREFGDGLHYVRGRNDDEPRLGPNGVGKSTLVSDALSWCLFGKTASGLRNTDVRPWQPAKGATRVSLSVSVGKEAHTITRSIKPNRLAIDRRECGQDDVVKLIGLDFDMFTNTILLGQGRPLFFDLPPREKMNLFANALGLDRWDDRAQRASNRVSEMDALVTNIMGTIDGLNSAADQLDELIKNEEERRDAWDDESREATKVAEREIRVLEKQASANRRLRDDADLAQDDAGTELWHYKKQLIKDEEALLRADRTFETAEIALEGHNSAIYKIVSDLRQMGEGDVCRSCGQALRGTAFEKHREKLKRDISVLEKNGQFEIDFSKAKKNQKLREHAVEKTRKAVKDYQEKMNTATGLFESHGKVQAELDAKLAALRKVMHARGDATNPHTATLRDLNKRIRILENELRDFNSELKEAKRKRERSRFWIKGFRDVRLYVLDEILQEMEMATNALLDEAGLVGWRVSYLVQRETARGSVSHGLSIMIRSPRSSGAVKWESWSGGEGQRLRIVGALALSEVLLNHAGVRTNLEVLDEPTQHLSEEGVDDLCEYLSERARRLHKKVFYIDHQSVESTRFASVTTIIRSRQGSRIEFTA